MRSSGYSIGGIAKFDGVAGGTAARWTCKLLDVYRETANGV
jgi:hypothetical protein